MGVIASSPGVWAYFCSFYNRHTLLLKDIHVMSVTLPVLALFLLVCTWTPNTRLHPRPGSLWNRTEMPDAQGEIAHDDSTGK